MRNFRLGYTAAAALCTVVFSLMLALVFSVGSNETLTRLCGYAVALCYPVSGTDTVLSGSIPQAKSTLQERQTSPPVQPEPETETETLPEQTTALPVFVIPDSEYVEPSDIDEMEKQFLDEYGEKEPSGKIVEEFFGNGSAVTAGSAAIRNSTTTKNPDYGKLLEEGARIKVGEKGEMLVLIIHTHTTEGYQLADTGVFYSSFSSRTSLPDRNIVRVGDMLTQVLRSYGIGVIHDTAVYDEAYNGAYSRSRTAILDYLEQYPSIQIVLDIHRDAIYYSENTRSKPTAEINGRKAAQVMIISGAQEGIVTDFPEWESNLAFALELQNKAASIYEGLMKPIYFCQRQYNMDLTDCSLLIEVGTDSNTIGEAVYSAYMLGNVLGELVNEYYGE